MYQIIILRTHSLRLKGRKNEFLELAFIYLFIKMKIYNILGHANQFCVETDTTTERKTDFISYKSHCVSIDRNKKTIVFGKDRDYSKTTRKHLYAFFDELGLYNLCDKKSVLQAIERGIYNTPYTQYKVAENYDL